MTKLSKQSKKYNTHTHRETSRQCITTPRSDKNRTDKSVAKMGVVKRSVVASANEIMLRPVKTHSIPPPPIAPLMACSLNDDVENTLLP